MSDILGLRRLLCIKKLNITDGFTQRSVKLLRSEARAFAGELRSRQSTALVLLDEQGRTWDLLCTCAGGQYAISNIGKFCDVHSVRPGYYFIFYADDDSILRLAVRALLPGSVEACIAASRAIAAAAQQAGGQPKACAHDTPGSSTSMCNSPSMQQSDTAGPSEAAGAPPHSSSPSPARPAAGSALQDRSNLQQLQPLIRSLCKPSSCNGPLKPGALALQPQDAATAAEQPLQQQTGPIPGKENEPDQPMVCTEELATECCSSSNCPHSDDSDCQPADMVAAGPADNFLTGGGQVEGRTSAWTPLPVSPGPAAAQPPTPPACSPRQSGQQVVLSWPPSVMRLRIRFEARIRAQTGRLHPLSVATGPNSPPPRAPQPMCMPRLSGSGGASASTAAQLQAQAGMAALARIRDWQLSKGQHMPWGSLSSSGGSDAQGFTGAMAGADSMSTAAALRLQQQRAQQQHADLSLEAFALQCSPSRAQLTCCELLEQQISLRQLAMSYGLLSHDSALSLAPLHGSQCSTLPALPWGHQRHEDGPAYDLASSGCPGGGAAGNLLPQLASPRRSLLGLGLAPALLQQLLPMEPQALTGDWDMAALQARACLQQRRRQQQLQVLLAYSMGHPLSMQLQQHVQRPSAPAPEELPPANVSHGGDAMDTDCDLPASPTGRPTEAPRPTPSSRAQQLRRHSEPTGMIRSPRRAEAACAEQPSAKRPCLHASCSLPQPPPPPAGTASIQRLATRVLTMADLTQVVSLHSGTVSTDALVRLLGSRAIGHPNQTTTLSAVGSGMEHSCAGCGACPVRRQVQLVSDMGTMYEGVLVQAPSTDAGSTAACRDGAAGDGAPWQLTGLTPFFMSRQAGVGDTLELWADDVGRLHARLYATCKRASSTDGSSVFPARRPSSWDGSGCVPARPSRQDTAVCACV